MTNTTPKQLALDIRDATHHLAQAVHLLLDAVYEEPGEGLAMVEGAHECCVRAQTTLAALRTQLTPAVPGETGSCQLAEKSREI